MAGGGEVWVAKGTYHPTDSGDREISFQLKSGVALYGGFAGTERELDQRDWEANSTILSGDISKPGDNSDNSYHVVQGANDATIDGFTITGGNADGDTSCDKGGGAIANDYQANLNVSNCTFIGNSAAEGDADIDTDDTSSAEVS